MAGVALVRSMEPSIRAQSTVLLTARAAESTNTGALVRGGCPGPAQCEGEARLGSSSMRVTAGQDVSLPQDHTLQFQTWTVTGGEIQRACL